MISSPRPRAREAEAVEVVVEDKSEEEVVEVEVEAVPDVEEDSEAAVEAPVSCTPKLYWDSLEIKKEREKSAIIVGILLLKLKKTLNIGV